jgi:hypothetical protein
MTDRTYRIAVLVLLVVIWFTLLDVALIVRERLV